jgi:hypothetical protein
MEGNVDAGRESRKPATRHEKLTNNPGDVPVGFRAQASMQGGPAPADPVCVAVTGYKFARHGYADDEGCQDDQPCENTAMDGDGVDPVNQDHETANDIEDGFHTNGFYEGLTGNGKSNKRLAVPVRVCIIHPNPS